MITGDETYFIGEPIGMPYKGITIRQQFAAMAMEGLCASGFVQRHNSKMLVIKAVEISDILIRELNKEV